MEQSLKKPKWLRIKLQTNHNFSGVRSVLDKFRLNTVCESAHCPNIAECWNGGTATFMLMGDTCTRGCKFCAIKTGNPMKKLDKEEPVKLAKAIEEIKLFDYVVLTSVNRDDLEDGGAGHFAECINEVKKRYPEIIIEVLIPDFNGDKKALRKIVDAKPEVIGHNIETVKRLQKEVRDVRANYEQSLSVVRMVKEMDSGILTKSAIMLGMGEQDEEVIEAMKDLREEGVDILTLGQYLRPSEKHYAIQNFVKPEKFEFFKGKGKGLGFKFVVAGPFVRSSYKAGEMFVKNILKR
tara:strand:+ start:10016 stop:10897 length:882 start_codon:yes stop_codon:yes gene_type:complete